VCKDSQVQFTTALTFTPSQQGSLPCGVSSIRLIQSAGMTCIEPFYAYDSS